jgi:hypothetical protein
MLIIILFTSIKDNATIFLVYLIIGNILVVIFYYLMMNFFGFCLSNEYEKGEITGNINDKIELLEITELASDANKNDIRKNFDADTLSYREILIKKIDVYLGMTLNFMTTLACFPVLTFRLDIGAEEYIKFTIITLIFNVGDITSRYIYSHYKLNSITTAHLLNAAKILFIFIHFVSIEAASGIFAWVPFKVLMIFSFAFLNGYLCMAYFAFASVGLISPYDRNRSGNILAMSLELGLMLGSCVSLFW